MSKVIIFIISTFMLLIFSSLLAMERVKDHFLEKKKARCTAQFLEAIRKKDDPEKLTKLCWNPYLDVHASLDDHGNKALHLVADQWFTIYPLLKRGACINARNAYGQTPLHFAVMLGSSSDVSHFISAGAEVDAQDNRGNTPLHRAFLLAQYCETLPHGEQRRVLYNDAYDKIKELIKQAHARINIKNVQGWLPADHDEYMIQHFAYGPFGQAIQQADLEAAQRIYAQGINVNIHHIGHAIESNNTALVRFLLDRSEDLSFEEVSYGCKSVEMAYFLVTYVSQALVRAQWNKVVVPVLRTHCLRGLPADVQKLICVYCVLPGIVAEQQRRAEICLKNLLRFLRFLENVGLGALLKDERFDVAKLCQYLPLWENQIKPILRARLIKRCKVV